MWAAIITGLFTLLAGLGGTLGVYTYSELRKRKAVKSAILAEIASIIDIAEAQHYREAMVRGAAGEVSVLAFEAPDSYRAVFDGNVSSIGILDTEDAYRIVRFYQFAGSIITTFKPGGLNTVDSQIGQEGFAGMLIIFDAMVDIGNKLLKKSE